MHASVWTLFLGIAVACWNAPSSAATIKSFPGKDRRVVVIQITGRIAEGDAELFIREVRQANDAGKVVVGVELNSAGGKLFDGAKLAGAIKVGKMWTTVAPGAVCASACFLAFAAGDPKFAADGALIGVHKASDKGGRETSASSHATQLMARFAKDLGVPSRIIARMVSTPASDISWLDAQELHAMGVAGPGKPVPTRLVTTDGLPIKQLPDQSTSLATLAPQPRANQRSWSEFIDKTIALSADQNEGRAALSRLCDQELKSCVMAVAYSLKDGRQGIATIVQAMDGSIARREVCESNAANDARDCVDWDTGAKYRDLKNTKGDWVQAIE